MAAESGGARTHPFGTRTTTLGARPAATYDTQPRFGRAAIGPRYYYGGFLLILAVGLALRIWNLGGASLWTDEALTALRAQAPFEQSFMSLANTGNQSPLYFWLLRLVPTTTEALLRLPSALLGAAGVALFMVLVARLYRDREMALWAGALLAVNPFHVWLSRTARPYSMMFLMALLVSYLFLLLLRGNQSRKLWIAYVLTSTITYSTHFTALVLPTAQYLVFGLVLRQKVGLFRRWIVAQALAAGPALFWVYVMLRDSAEVGSHWIPIPELRDIPLTLWNMTLGYDGVFKWHMVPGLMIVTLGVVFGLGTAFNERRKNLNNLYWMWMIVAPVLPVFIMSRYIVSIYVDRYFTVFLPALILLAIGGWMRYSRQVWRVALAIIIVTGAYTVLFSFYSGTYHRADWRGAARYVAEGYQAGDAILLERDNTHEAFGRYYMGGEFRPGTLPDLDNPIALLSMLDDTTALERSAQRLWVVYRNPNEDVHRMGLMPDFDPFDATLAPMGKWLHDRQGQVIEQRTYNGIRVLLLDMQPAQVATGQP